MITPFTLPGLLLVRPKRFVDGRGWFSQSYTFAHMSEHGLPAFVQDNEAFNSVPGTVRGLHFQRGEFAQAKLIRCVVGAIHDVVLDLRPQSATFGQHAAVRLDATEGAQLYVPAGFAHGYCSLEPDTIVHYKVSRPYAPHAEGGILWNDPGLTVDWPVDAPNAIVSEKDRALPRLADAIL